MSVSLYDPFLFPPWSVLGVHRSLNMAILWKGGLLIGRLWVHSLVAGLNGPPVAAHTHGISAVRTMNLFNRICVSMLYIHLSNNILQTQTPMQLCRQIKAVTFSSKTCRFRPLTWPKAIIPGMFLWKIAHQMAKGKVEASHLTLIIIYNYVYIYIWVADKIIC